jgi:hypothetical protein
MVLLLPIYLKYSYKFLLFVLGIASPLNPAMQHFETKKPLKN